MILLVLLHGEGPIVEFGLKVGIALPIIFATITWLAWWLDKGRYPDGTQKAVALKSAGMLLSLWLLGLLAVVPGFVVTSLGSGLIAQHIPRVGTGETLFFVLFFAPTVLFGYAIVSWGIGRTSTRGRAR